MTNPYSKLTVEQARDLYERKLRESPGYGEWVASRRAARLKRERREAFWQGLRAALGIGPRRDMSPEARLQRALDGIKHDRGLT